MITSATIENFKGFKHLQLSDLARITLLGGRNNVGKTSVLEAFFLFYDRLEMNFFLNHFAWRGIGTVPVEADAVLAPIFRNYRMNRRIIISIAEESSQETLEITFNLKPQKSIEVREVNENTSQVNTTLRPSSSYALDLVYKSKGKEDQKSRFIIGSDRIEIETDFAATGEQVAIFLASRTKARANDDAIKFGQLDIEGKQNTVVEFLQILEPRLKSLSTITTGQTSLVYGDIGIGRKIPVALMGEGIDRLLSIILAIATTRGGLILIDEVENGLHHSIMAKVWESIGRAAEEFNCQIVATTHSYECLQAAFDGTAAVGLMEEFRYIRLDRRDEDIVAKTYTHPMIGAAFEQGWEVR